jgi:hypothetical protein
VGKVI